MDVNIAFGEDFPDVVPESQKMDLPNNPQLPG